MCECDHMALIGSSQRERLLGDLVAVEIGCRKAFSTAEGLGQRSAFIERINDYLIRGMMFLYDWHLSDRIARTRLLGISAYRLLLLDDPY